MCSDIWYSSLSPFSIEIFTKPFLYERRRPFMCHVTTISESRLREQIKNTCDNSTYFRPFILLYFNYISPYLYNPMCSDIWYSSISPFSIEIFTKPFLYERRRLFMCHVTMISESRLREQISNTCDNSTYFRPFILLYFNYISPYLCNHMWIDIYNRLVSQILVAIMLTLKLQLRGPPLPTQWKTHADWLRTKRYQPITTTLTPRNVIFVY